MNNNRVWVIGSLLLSVVILAGGWFIGVAPMLAAATLADSDRIAVEAENLKQEATLADLQARYALLPKVSAELAELRLSLPDAPQLADFLRTVIDAGADSGSLVTDVSVADALPYAPVIPEPVPAPVVEESDTAPEGEVAVAAPLEPTAAVAVLDTAGIPNADSVSALNFSLIPVTVTADGTLDQVLAFTGQLQQSERLFLVNGVTISTDESTGVITGAVTGFLYVFGDPSGTVTTADGAEAPAN